MKVWTDPEGSNVLEQQMDASVVHMTPDFQLIIPLYSEGSLDAEVSFSLREAFFLATAIPAYFQQETQSATVLPQNE